MAPLPSEMLDLYPTARLQVLGGVVVIQPVWQGAVAGPSLSLDLETGSVCEAEHPPILEDYTLIYGVLGLLSLTSGPAIAVITGIEQARQGWEQPGEGRGGRDADARERTGKQAG